MRNIILNRGGAGISISREETVESLRPLVRRLNELHLLYVSTLGGLDTSPERAQLETLLRRTRMDIDKLEESIYSAGGQSARMRDIGTLEMPDSDAGEGELQRLYDAERAQLEAMRAEARVRHHIRTQAILMNVETNSQARLNLIEEMLRKPGQAA